MLRKQKRLKRSEFNRIFSTGKKIHTPHFQLIHQPHKGFHVSVVVSKKIARASVERNVLRRRIYNIMKELNAHNVTQGAFIIVVKQVAATLSYQTLKEELLRIVGRINK